MVPVNLSSVWLAGNDIFLLYALKDFHKRWVEDKTLKDDKIDKSSSVSLDNEDKFIVKKKRNFGAIEPITGR